MRVWPGRPFPLGATWDGRGVNFAIFSAHAMRIELCLFESTDLTEVECVPLREQTDLVWHCYLPGVKPGQLYGYRVHGHYDPLHGSRFNPNKVVLDPYARLVGRDVQWSDTMFGYEVGNDDEDLSYDDRDNADCAPLGQVIDNSFSWGRDKYPRTPWNQTVIYETHVGGLTQLHPDVPQELQGKYLGLCSAPMLRHFRRLGVTAIELMPVHHRVNDRHLVERDLNNYWGYNNLSYFAPEPRFATSPEKAVREFKTMVKRLHAAGLEVILDVVYNHTGEGNQMGPTLSLRGIDNASYYRLADPRRYYVDYTGCGNTLNTLCPQVLQLIMDSLRYWVQEMHVDGFRFDLAVTLGRELHEFDRLGAFLDIIQQDPVLSRVKLIAEPWDLGSDGYRVGNFPVLWSEWNGKYRDTVRGFWHGGHNVSDFATRMSGSSDLYALSGRRPYASINFVTSHDGFCMRDLVSYNQKHNAANGHDNTDGDNHNHSWNCGVEGETNDPKVKDLRMRQMRNFMATLMLSQGVPMIRSGDEICHTQQGNNNAYCQENEISWLNWELSDEARSFMDFVGRMIRLRKANPVLRRQHFFRGGPKTTEPTDIRWLNRKACEVEADEWNSESVKALGVLLNGDMIGEVNEQGVPVKGQTLLVLFNTTHDPVVMKLPATPNREFWHPVLDTAQPPSVPHRLAGGGTYRLEAHSVAVMVRQRTRLLSWASK